MFGRYPAWDSGDEYDNGEYEHEDYHSDEYEGGEASNASTSTNEEGPIVVSSSDEEDQ